MEPRNPIIAGVLSAVFPGLGQFYVGRWVKGLAFLLVALVVIGWGAINGAFEDLENSLMDCSDLGCIGPITRGILFVILLPLAIWSIVSAVRIAKGLTTPRRIGNYNSVLTICILGLLVSCNQPNLELGKEYPSPDEEEEFRQHVQTINEIQKRLSKEFENKALLRGFHAKAHGCLRGEFIVLPNRPESTKFGIFKETKTYPIWVRFSNGVGFIQPDKTRDVRGIAIKVMGVEGKKLLDGEEDARTQDFLMTNNPTALTSNAKDFMEFAEAQDSMVSQALFFLTHPRSLMVVIRIALREIPTLLDEQYWSGTPIMLGNQAIKFSVVKPVDEKPCDRNHKFLSQHAEGDYLAHDLSNYAATGPICFDFLVQVQTDPYTTPIEDALVEWKESDAKFVKVARVILPKQEFLSAKQRQFCELLNFTPWHALPEHRPLGNMNRARKAVYEASQVFRKSGQRTPEPDGSEQF